MNKKRNKNPDSLLGKIDNFFYDTKHVFTKRGMPWASTKSNGYYEFNRVAFPYKYKSSDNPNSEDK